MKKTPEAGKVTSRHAWTPATFLNGLKKRRDFRKSPQPLRLSLAINAAPPQSRSFIMIYESQILMQWKTNQLQRVSRRRIRHHVFDAASELGHSFKLKDLICKYTLADTKRGAACSYFDVWKEKAAALR